MRAQNSKKNNFNENKIERHLAYIDTKLDEYNAAVYRNRQSIVEHPYGTIKRQWGFDHIITKKGMKRASADVGLMFIAYNLRRLLNIINKNVFTEFLQELVVLFKRKKGRAIAIIFKMADSFFTTRIRQVFLCAS
jgi:Transposase DDE domain